MTFFNVKSGHPISGVVLSGGDFAYVSSGGVAISTVVPDQTGLTVFSGGAASFTVLSGGIQYVSSGGTASGTLLSGGTEAIDGGTALDSQVGPNGSEDVYAGGMAVGATLNGGLEGVYAGGTASATVISSGGGEYVYTSGTAAGTVVSGGGDLTVYGGGTANATVVSGGGVLTVNSGANVSFTTVSLGGAIDLPSLVYSGGGSATVGGTDLLTVVEGANSASLQLAGTYTGLVFQPTEDAGNDTLLTLEAPCFAAGTHILTKRGEIAVEHLGPGDIVLTHLGDPRTVTWIGHRRVDISRHANPARVRPIRIAAEAFPGGKPHRDLVVSADHALFIDDMLIPAKLLVNHASITVDTDTRWVTYYHVELEDHDVLLAEGLPAESYLDTGNRASFANGGEPLRLHPDFAGEQWLRETYSCAPLVTEAERVEPVWRALAEQAAVLGWTLPAPVPTVDEPDLHVLAGSRRIEPLSARDGHYVFALPAGDAPLRLVSRAARPCEAQRWVGDDRRLGVLVRRLTLRSGREVREVALDGPLPGGWNATEWHALGPCRWTTGDALLPDLGGGVLEVVLGGTMRYAVEEAVPAGVRDRRIRDRRPGGVTAPVSRRHRAATG